MLHSDPISQKKQENDLLMSTAILHALAYGGLIPDKALEWLKSANMEFLKKIPQESKSISLICQQLVLLGDTKLGEFIKALPHHLERLDLVARKGDMVYEADMTHLLRMINLHAPHIVTIDLSCNQLFKLDKYKFETITKALPKNASTLIFTGNYSNQMTHLNLMYFMEGLKKNAPQIRHLDLFDNHLALVLSDGMSLSEGMSEFLPAIPASIASINLQGNYLKVSYDYMKNILPGLIHDKLKLEIENQVPTSSVEARRTILSEAHKILAQTATEQKRSPGFSTGPLGTLFPISEQRSSSDSDTDEEIVYPVNRYGARS